MWGCMCLCAFDCVGLSLFALGSCDVANAINGTREKTKHQEISQ